MADKEPIIVAIELGTSRICGIAGKKKDGNLQILAYAEEKAIGCIKRGLVFNIEKTTKGIKTVIAKLESSLKLKISQVYIGLSGQSLRSIHSKVRRNLVTPSYINASHIDSMRSESYEVNLPDYELLENVPQGYVVDGNEVYEPVGVMGTNIEGEFINVVARRKLKGNIENCFNNTSVRIVDTFISAFELAKCTLTDQEKRAGSVLVDLGAGTTSVVVYRNNILRYLVTLPIGMANITQDLMTFQMDEQEAERVKIKYGNAYIDDNDNSDEMPKDEYYETQYNRKVKVTEIQHYIYARLTEILENVKNQISNSGFDNQLLGCVVLTGGGACMKNIEEAFRHLNLNVDKVRIANKIEEQVIKNSNVTHLNYEQGEGLSIISLLAAGDANCVGDVANEPDIFNKENEEKVIQQQKANLEQQEKEEATALQELENRKNALRTRISEVEKKTSEVSKNLKDKKARKQLESLVSLASELLSNDNDATFQPLESKEKYKQTLHEAEELKNRLETSLNQARDIIAKAKKENSFWNKLQGALTDIVEDKE